MDAYSSPSQNILDQHLPPVLIASTSEAGIRRAEMTIEDQGLRVGARLPIEEALDRIGRQGSATAVWIEIDRHCGEQLQPLLDQVGKDVADGRYGAIVSVTGREGDLPDLLDPVSALFDHLKIELLANADPVDRIAALATVKAKLHSQQAVCDASNDRNTERLRQLSEEVSRIATTLARLSAGPAPSTPAQEPMPSGEIPPLSADTIAKVIRARRLRGRFFSEELFADPAWDMLLDLLQSEIRQFRVPVSSLCIAAAVPATTALRWLKALVTQGLFIRRADPHDGRRVFVELAPETSLAMRRYFAEVGPVVPI